MTRREELAWAAGLFEGEGSVGFIRVNGPRGVGRAQLRTDLGMTDKDAVERFTRVVGCGSICQRPGTNKPIWQWRACGVKNMTAIYRAFRPWLGERRRARFEEVLALDAEPRRTDPQDHCLNGHRFTADNLYIDPQGRPSCRTCRRAAVKRYNERKAA